MGCNFGQVHDKLGLQDLSGFVECLFLLSRSGLLSAN